MNKMHFPKLALLSSALPLFINACAMLPEDGARATAMAVPSLTQTLQTNPETARIVQQWPRAQWWRDFHNAELDRLLDTALRGSPTLKAAAARLEQAAAVADYQAAELLPSVGASIEFHQRRFSATDFYGPNGGKTFTGAYLDPAVFRYHLDLWGQDRAALEAALGTQRAQASELAVARLLLSGAIARAYFQLGSAEERSDLAHTLAEQSADKLQLAQLRWERGLDARDAVHAGEQKLAAARQRESSLRAEAQLLRNRLAALAGQGPDWGRQIQASASVFAEPFPLPEKLPLGLLAHRPDVAAALWRVEAAARLVKVAETRFYPDVNLVGFAGLRSLDLKDLFVSQGASLAYSIGPTVTLPLFEGGRLEAELKNQQAGYDAAVEAYNETLLAAVRQVADALAQWRESLAHDAAQQQALRAAEAEAEVAGRRYRAGLGPRDGEIDAAYALTEQRLQSSALDSAHLQAAVGLFEALGGGYENPTTTSLPTSDKRP